MFDRNPKDSPAAIFIAGKTTEAVLRAANSPDPLPEGVTVTGLISALVSRFDRKAEHRASRADAA